MRLNDPNFEDRWVNVYPVGTSAIAFDESLVGILRQAGAVQNMWDWLPRISGGGTSFESYLRRVKSLTDQGLFFPMMMSSKVDDEVMGGASFLRLSRTHRSVEIGFTILKEEFRDWISFATVQRAMIARAQAWGARRIVWSVSTTNGRMMRAMERVGTHLDGVMRSAYRMNDGSWNDTAIYSLVRDEISDCIKALDVQLEASL